MTRTTPPTARHRLRSGRWARSAAALTAVLGLALLAVTAAAGRAATPKPALTRQQVAQLLLAHGHARYLTAAALRALQLSAGVTPAPTLPVAAEATRAAAATPAATAARRAGLVNVRVNNPAADSHQVDQTTQSETSIAVAGAHVAVAFNDSQQALLALTDGLDLSGYAYSADGGRSFTDGGTLPNPVDFVNIGDPWLASDRAGRMYYSTLTFGGGVGNVEVAVGRSDNGGRTWSTPVIASPDDESVSYGADKDAVTAGRDARDATRDDVYAVWSDNRFDPATGVNSTGLAVATSRDHGATWTRSYADRITSDPGNCSFAQYLGAQPVVDPADGTLRVAAEKVSVDDPACTGTVGVQFSQVLFTSGDSGASFGPAVTVAPVTPATPNGILALGRGRDMRTADFPTMAVRGNTVWLAWNDGTSGLSHIRLATSSDRGRTWSLSWLTGGSGDELQPAMTVDRAGVHVAYYQRNADNSLDTVVSDATFGGVRFATAALTTRSFPAVQTVPQFDPQEAPAYMGDYISVVSDGRHQYFAWGDNRNRIVNFTHPQGRNDPDVYFARR